jgi:UDP-N-acetylmuramate dehydrogenase
VTSNLDRLFHALSEQLPPSQIRRAESLAQHTTLRLGGPAEIWVAVRSVDELVTAVTLGRAQNCPVFVYGGGANLVVGPAGIPGLAIENQAKGVNFADDVALVESGTVNPRLAQHCLSHNLSGFEWAVGVPGTVGGAVVNNAGAYGTDIAANLRRAELLTPQNERVWREVAWFEYGYRTSKLKQLPPAERPIVLQAEFRFQPAAPNDIRARMQGYTERRRTTQPPGATVGSMFKNPPGDYAGRLIEAVGLKGHQIGQAQISPVHANFFVNLGQAETSDVLALIDLARQKVKEKFGLELDLEIELINTLEAQPNPPERA